MSYCPYYNLDCPSWDDVADECVEEFYAIVFQNPQQAWQKRCAEIRQKLKETQNGRQIGAEKGQGSSPYGVNEMVKKPKPKYVVREHTVTEHWIARVENGCAEVIAKTSNKKIAEVLRHFFEEQTNNVGR